LKYLNTNTKLTYWST